MPYLSKIQIGNVIYDNKDSEARAKIDALCKVVNTELIDNNSLDSVAISCTFTNGTSATVTYTWNENVCTVNGTANATSYNIIYDHNDGFPYGIKAGETYRVKVDTEDENLYFDMYYYVGSSSTRIGSFTEDSYLTIPGNATGLIIRVRTATNATVANKSCRIRILSALTNKELKALIDQQTPKYNVNILVSSSDTYNYLIRCEYDESNDIVYSIGIPSKKYNFVISMNDMRLIAKTTPLSNTESAYMGANVYKPLDDEIPPMRVNDVFIGSNHGNPNYTLVYCQHNLTESAIGTTWADEQSNSYTLVNVFSDRLIFGTLDSNQQLVVRSPRFLTSGGTTITVTSSADYHLRRSSINKHYSIRNDCGQDVSNGGGGNNIIVTEEYDINDQSAGLAYLRNNVGNCTNKSYYDDGQTTILCHIINTFQFNRNGSMTCYMSFIAKKSLVNNKIFGCMSLDFSTYETGYTDNVYVPNSANCKNIKSYVGSEDQFNITDDSTSPILHHRYYQISGNGFGHFLHLLNLGCYDEGTRRNNHIVENPAWHSKTAKKIYTNITGETQMSNGDVLSWGYGRGPYKYTSDQTVLCWFDYNQGYIVSMDWHNDYSGIVKLPYYMAGKSVDILEKTESVIVLDDIVTNIGVQVSCNDYGYVVMYLH